MLQCVDLLRALQVEHNTEPSREYNVRGEAKVAIVESPNERPRESGQSIAGLEGRLTCSSEERAGLRSRDACSASTCAVFEVSR